MKLNDKTKQLLQILKWQALVVKIPDNKMFSVGGFLSIWMLWQGLFWSVQIKTVVKNAKEFKEIIKYLFLLFFLGLFYLVLLLATATLNSQRGEDLQRQT